MDTIDEATNAIRSASNKGLRWPSVEHSMAKFHEEYAEFSMALADQDIESMEDEAGDVMFAFIGLCRWLHIDPNNALDLATTKFRLRMIDVIEKANPGDDLRLVWEELKRSR